MIGGWARNVLLLLVIGLWAWMAADFNTRYFAFIYTSAQAVFYYLLVPGIVIAASLFALVRRRRKRFSGRDVALVGWPILFFPLYLLPLQ